MAAKKPKVKCPICKEEFYREEVEWVQYGARRYAHKSCVEDKKVVEDTQTTQLEKEYKELEDYIKKLFGSEYINARIRKQMVDFKNEYGYSYSGMLKSLKYWYEVKKESKDKANKGIGIIPFIYDDCREYYYRLFLLKTANDLDNLDKIQYKEEEVYISSPQKKKRKIKLFNLDESEEN